MKTVDPEKLTLGIVWLLDAGVGESALGRVSHHYR